MRRTRGSTCVGSVTFSCTIKTSVVLTMCNHLTFMPIMRSMPVNRDLRGLEAWWVLAQLSAPTATHGSTTYNPSTQE